MSKERFSLLRAVGLGDLKGQPARIQFTFWIMLVSAFFLFADQNLPASNLSRMAEAFGMLDEKEYRFLLGGLVTLPFFVLGGFISILYGRLTDRLDRRKLLVTAVVLGELPCLLTGFANDYWTYFALRMLTGFGLGGIFPVLFSITGDLFRTENRPTASAWVGLAMSLGIGVGQVLGGVLAHDVIFGLEGWRFSFILVAAPAFPVAALFYFFAQIPEHGAADARQLEEISTESNANVVVEEPVSLNSFRRVFRTKTNILAFLQGIPGTVPWGFLFVYAQDFFEVERGWGVETAYTIVTLFAVMTIAGGFLGGFIGKKLYLINRKWFPAFCSATVILGAIPVFFLVNYNGAELWPAFVFALLGGL
ncbi:MAG: MFS transporter, partial [Leptospiraceae bacterium]|nr:MFS transporter [Leptospiraceae bacterium]